MLKIGTRKKWGFISILIIITLVMGLAVGFKAYQKHQARQAQLRFAAAEELYNYKKYQEAAKEYEFVAAKYPRSEYVPACWYKAGYIYRYFLFDDAAAARALKNLLDLFPGNQYRKETLVLLVDIYARLGQYEEQNDTIKRLLTEFPGDVDEDVLRLELAKGFYQLGQNKEALEQLALIKNKASNVIRNSQEYYQLLISRDPSDPQPHVELARIFAGMGLKEKAKGELAVAAIIKQMIAKAKVKSAVSSGIKAEIRPLTEREKMLWVEYSYESSYGQFFQRLEQYQKRIKETGRKIIDLLISKMEKEWWEKWFKRNNTTRAQVKKIEELFSKQDEPAQAEIRKELARKTGETLNDGK